MVKILGHRGGRALWPENSLFGFRQAVALGVDIIEFDVHLSKDGQAVVIHDPTLDRTTTARGIVSARTVGELAEARLQGREDESVTALDRVLETLAGSGVELAIEIKTGPDAAPYQDFERIVLDCIRQHDAVERAIIISFVPECLERVRAIMPDIKVQACVWRPQSELMGGLASAIARFSRIDGCILAVQEELLTLNEQLCRRLVDGKRLAVGINNDPARLRYWLGQSVRHVSTDFPDKALAIRRELSER